MSFHTTETGKIIWQDKEKVLIFSLNSHINVCFFFCNICLSLGCNIIMGILFHIPYFVESSLEAMALLTHLYFCGSVWTVGSLLCTFIKYPLSWIWSYSLYIFNILLRYQRFLKVNNSHSKEELYLYANVCRWKIEKQKSKIHSWKQPNYRAGIIISMRLL